MNGTHKFYRASAYIESLRHAVKKRYARDYYQWLRAGEQGDSPTRPDLSEMTAQAVRMNLREIMDADSSPDQPAESFSLTRDSATCAKPKRYTNNERKTQRVLLTGLDCIEGQQDLFNPDGA